MKIFFKLSDKIHNLKTSIAQKKIFFSFVDFKKKQNNLYRCELKTALLIQGTQKYIIFFLIHLPTSPPIWILNVHRWKYHWTLDGPFYFLNIPQIIWYSAKNIVSCCLSLFVGFLKNKTMYQTCKAAFVVLKLIVSSSICDDLELRCTVFINKTLCNIPNGLAFICRILYLRCQATDVREENHPFVPLLCPFYPIILVSWLWPRIPP